MGEGSNRLNLAGSPRTGSRVRHVSSEIEALRADLGSIVAEIDRRRKEAMDIGLQLRRHPAAAAAVAVGAALLVGGAVAWAIRRRRKRHELRARAKEVRRAVQAIVKDPYHVAKDSTLTEKLVATAATTLVGLVVKRAIDRFTPPVAVHTEPRTRRTRDGAPHAAATRPGF